MSITGGSRLTLLAAALFVLLLAGYVQLGMGLRQTYEGETALADSLARTGPVWQAARKQPLDEPGPLQQQILAAQEKVARQQTLFPKNAEVIAVLDGFLSLAQKQQIQVSKVEAQAVSEQKTKAGVYQVARYRVRAKGSWLSLAPFFRKLAEQGEFVAMGFENLSVVTGAPDGDDLSFDLLIYVRTG